MTDDVRVAVSVIALGADPSAAVEYTDDSLSVPIRVSEPVRVVLIHLNALAYILTCSSIHTDML